MSKLIKILKFISNKFKFFDEYGVAPNIKEKLIFDDKDIKQCEASAKHTNYLAYFFKEEYLTQINSIIQKLNDNYGDIENKRNVWLKSYYKALENFLNQHNINDVLTEQGKPFSDALKSCESLSDNEKKTTINKFQVTDNISCNFNKQIDAIDFSCFNALLDVKSC